MCLQQTWAKLTIHCAASATSVPISFSMLPCVSASPRDTFFYSSDHHYNAFGVAKNSILHLVAVAGVIQLVECQLPKPISHFFVAFQVAQNLDLFDIFLGQYGEVTHFQSNEIDCARVCLFDA